MRKFENNQYVVVIENNKVVITKKYFGDRYVAELVDGKLVAKSALALDKAIKCRAIFGF